MNKTATQVIQEREKSHDLLDVMIAYEQKMAEIMVLGVDYKIITTVDPNDQILETLPSHTHIELGSIAMNERNENDRESAEGFLNENEFTGLFDSEFEDFEEDEETFDEPEYTVREFLARLENFLVDELDEASRGNVFMSKNGDGVALNILVGAPFAGTEEQINQINVIVSPTDRTLLSSTGVSMDDRADEYDDEYNEDEDASTSEAFDRAMEAL